MSSSPRVLLLAVLAGLALPAGAEAATYTVTPGTKVATAAAAAKSGDTILIKAGSYPESVEVKEPGVAVEGEPGALLTGDPGASGATPTLSFTAADGAPDTVSRLVVVNAVTTGPAIAAGAAGVAVTESLVVGAKGAGIGVAGAGANGAAVVRALVYGLTSAVAFSSSSTGAKALVVDSSVLLSGSDGAGIRAASNGAPGSKVSGARPGPLTVTARHVTVDGAKTPLVVDAKATSGTLAGNVTATFTDSIVLPASAAASRQCAPPPAPQTLCLPPPPGQVPGVPTAPGSADDGTVSAATVRTLTSGRAAALFVDPAKANYHLRADAAVIGLGGFTAGESTTDFDGQPRAVDGVSDLGADQFVNGVPTAAVSGSKTAREGRPATFDGAGSADPDVGGSIVAYRWDFGDGETASTTTPRVEHTYARRGSYTTTLTVLDNRGGASSAASTAIEVLDGVAPVLKIGSPQTKQRIALRKVLKPRKGQKRAKLGKRLKIELYGSASDDTGVAAVVLTLRKAARAKDGRCYFYDPKSRSFKARSCARPIALTARLRGNQWSYTLPPTAKLKPGAYTLVGVAYDSTGLPGAATYVNFRLR